MPFGIPDTRQFPWDQSLTDNLSQLTNKATGGINTWSTVPMNGVDGLALGPNHVGYTGINTQRSSLDRWNGSAWESLLKGSKLAMGDQLNIYISQDTGSDSNDGKTAQTAWKTISKFYQELKEYNLLEKQVNLYLAAGTYSIEFPQALAYNSVRIYGASSASVTIQSMFIHRSMTVLVQDVTFAYPNLPDTTDISIIHLRDTSTLYIGPNVVFGKIGNFINGRFRTGVRATNDSVIYCFSPFPLTVTGSINQLFFLLKSSLNFMIYTPPGPAPVAAIDKGVVLNYFPPMSPADITCAINYVGNLSTDEIFRAAEGSMVWGPGQYKLIISGNLIGKGYFLQGSGIWGHVVRGTPPTFGIGFPTTISAGVMSTDSYVVGTPL